MKSNTIQSAIDGVARRHTLPGDEPCPDLILALELAARFYEIEKEDLAQLAVRRSASLQVRSGMQRFMASTGAAL